MSVAHASSAPAPDLSRRGSGIPWVLTGFGAVIVALLFLPPLIYLVVEAAKAGTKGSVSLIFRPLTGELLWNTVFLTVTVTVLCAVIGTAVAWLVERTDLPGRGLFAILLVVPFAVPDFVMSFGWVTVAPWIQGAAGAILVMTLTLFPLVFLPVSASLRASDATQEEYARSLGVSRTRTFFSVTLGQIRGGLIGGCLLVSLIMLAEYGAFELLAFQSFTTEIWTEFEVSFNVPTAAVLSLILLVLSIVVLIALSSLQRDRHVARTGALVQRESRPHALGMATFPAFLFQVVLLALSVGVPVGASIYWMVEGGASSLSGVGVFPAALTTILYCGSASLIATVMAVPIAILAVRHRGPGTFIVERTSYLLLAMPGFVVAFALSYFSEHFFHGFLYQTSPMVVAAFAILFFPLALVGVRASIAHAPAGLEEAASTLGRSRASVLGKVTLPALAPGLAAAFCLVFIAAETELTATLVLAPTGIQTLSTQFWAYQQNLAYGQAAPFAIANMIVAIVPCIILGRYFDRLPARARRT